MEQNTARNFALQLGSLISLYTCLAALVMVIFGVINIAYPDAINGYWEYESAQGGIRFGIAMLIVFFPTYIVLTRYVNTIRRRETGTYMTLTKWLVYLSLLVGGAILLGDFVSVILTYLNGEITVRFLLKALALSVIVGAAFYYYVQDSRGYWIAHEKESKMYGYGACAFVIIVLALGFMHSDSPKEVREMRLDQQQISDLMDMQYRVEDHYRINGSLPESIDPLYVGVGAPEAPENRPSYEYRTVDEDTYELCATFARATRDGQSRTPARESIARNPYNNWDHGEGQTCFERTILEEPKILEL